MAKSIATVTGTFLVPGVSRNGRLYTTDHIAEAAARGQARIDSGGPPLTMRVSHPAKEANAPVTEIVGGITRLWQDADGRGRFTASIADTDAGRDVLKLVETRDGKPPYLRGVSIRGSWVGKARSVTAPDGSVAETADGVELDGLDFTHKPGVIGAEVDQVSDPDDNPRETADDGRVLILESVQEALVTTISEADSTSSKAPYGDVVYADPGYQKDGKKRYPLDTKAHAKAAWSYVNQEKNANQYSAAQLKRIRQRIIKALKKFGVQVDTTEGWLVEPATQVTEAALTECFAAPDQAGSLYVSLTNGPICVTVSAYCLDPHDLAIVGRAAMEGACGALTNIDPDLDGDIDLPGAAGDTDRDAAESEAGADGAAQETTATTEPVAETAATADVTNTTSTTPTTPTPAPSEDATSNNREEPAMAESTQAAEASGATQAGPGIFLSNEQFEALLARVGTPAPAAAPTESAPAVPAPVAETTPATPAAPAATQVAESEEDRINRIVEARVTAAIQGHVEKSGPPTRKGLVTETDASATAATASGESVNAHGLPEGWPDKPLHQYSRDEWNRYVAPTSAAAILGNRAR